MAFPGGVRLLLLVHFLIAVGCLLANNAQAKSFLPVDLKWTGLRKVTDDAQPNLTDLLVFKDPDQDPVLKKAMGVIHNLAMQSTCHQSAATQLLITCKAIGKDFTEGQDHYELLERAKSVYAVRVAVCETGEGQAPTPTSCQTVLKAPHRSARELDVVSGKDLSSCLNALMEEHYYWTSYSNSRQDANTLCQAGSLDANRLEAIRSYEKLAELIPEFREALLSTQSQWLDFTAQQEEAARSIHKLNLANRDELKEHHQVELGALRRAMSVAKEGLDEVSQVFKQSIAKADSDIGQTQEALGHVLTDFTNLKDLMADSIQTIAANTAEITAVQAQDMRGIHELSLAVIGDLKDLQESEVAQTVNDQLHHVQVQLGQIVAAQATQLADAETHLKLSKELSEAQKATLVWGKQMKDSSASLALELDGANFAAGRVSSKLDKVNEALSRLEKASSMLTTLSAMLSIPFQLVEKLHLKILALLGMPALVLYLWKPARYSYSLMAFYVFVEVLMSFITEYQDEISSTISQLALLGREMAMWSLRLLDVDVLTLGFLLAAITSFLVWTSWNAPDPEDSFAHGGTALDEECAITNQYYMEYRVHNGRYRRHPLDRYRRAATVC